MALPYLILPFRQNPDTEDCVGATGVQGEEFAKSFSVGDEKAGKLSKSEQEQEKKDKALEAEKIVKETMDRLIYLVARSSSRGRMMPRLKIIN